jgi:hypothetical protein
MLADLERMKGKLPMPKLQEELGEEIELEFEN